MKAEKAKIRRRDFISRTSAAVAGAVVLNPASVFTSHSKSRRTKLALVGTGIRGAGMWGRKLVKDYSDFAEMVGLADINPGRISTYQIHWDNLQAHEMASCPFWWALQLERVSRAGNRL